MFWRRLFYRYYNACKDNFGRMDYALGLGWGTLIE